MITYVIPCGGAKEDHPTLARHLYTGAMFRQTLASVQAMADGEDAQILILSARYGLVRLDEVIAPYEQRMDRRGRVGADTITIQAMMYGLTDVYAFLPGAYFTALDTALRPLGIYPQDVYEGTGGIGDQRHVNKVVATC